VGHHTAFSEAKRNAGGEFASGGFPKDYALILYSEVHVVGRRFRLQFYLSIHIRGKLISDHIETEGDAMSN
jgi:hypothetical protein